MTSEMKKQSKLTVLVNIKRAGSISAAKKRFRWVVSWMVQHFGGVRPTLYRINVWFPIRDSIHVVVVRFYIYIFCDMWYRIHVLSRITIAIGYSLSEDSSGTVCRPLQKIQNLQEGHSDSEYSPSLCSQRDIEKKLTKCSSPRSDPHLYRHLSPQIHVHLNTPSYIIVISPSEYQQ